MATCLREEDNLFHLAQGGGGRGREGVCVWKKDERSHNHGGASIPS